MNTLGSGQMQLHYEHCLPMKQDDENAKRSAIVFRHGATVPVSLDTGIPLMNEPVEETQSSDLDNQRNSSHFGHVGGEIREGKKLYTKEILKRSGAHRYELSKFIYIMKTVLLLTYCDI